MRKLYMLLILVLLLVGCSSNDSLVNNEKEYNMITFLHYFSDELSGGIDEMVEKYNTTQDESVLKAVPIDHESYKLSVIGAIKSNSPSDIYSYWAGAKTQSIIEDLEPITDVWNDNNLNDDFPKHLVDAASVYNGEKYLLPITQHYVTFFYNKKIFEQYEIEIPKTWNELNDVADILVKNNITPFELGNEHKWPAQFWFDYILLRTAGYDYRESLMNGNASYLDDEVKVVFSMWKDLIDKGYFNEDMNNIDWNTVVAERLANNESAMTLMGTWLMPILDTVMEAGIDYDYFSFPIIDPSIDISALGPVDGLIIPKTSKNISKSKKVAVYFAKEESQIAMSIGSGAFAPNQNVDVYIYSPLQLRMLNDISDSVYWSFNYDLSTIPAVSEIGLDLFYEFIEFPEAIDELLKEKEIKIDEIWREYAD